MKNKKLQEDWKEVELGEICEIKKGNSITKSTIKNGDVPVIAGGQQPAYYHNISNRTGETITVSGSGAYAGFVAYFDIPIFASDCSTIQEKEKDVFIKYIYYFLKCNQDMIYEMQKGMAQPHVYPKDLAIMKVPLPPLSTQKQIVSILEKAENLKEKREDADKLTKEYLQSVFNEMFGDPVRNNKKLPFEILENVCSNDKNSLKRGPFGGSLKKEIFVNEGYKVYEQQNSIYNDMTLGDYYVTKEKYEEMIDFAVKFGDFIISCSGTMGKIAFIPRNAPEGIINQALLKITLDKNKINNTYFKFLFQSDSLQGHLFSISRGSGISNFPPMKEIRNLKIILPKMELQQKFASIVEEVEKLKIKQKQSKEELNVMFDSLMKQAFNGELVK